jgi:hypothetical protein
MIVRRPLAVIALCLALVATATADVPRKMNYQVMLTDDLDGPLADQEVELVFRIFATAGEPAFPLWSETHNVTTNSIGVASVILGSTNPINVSFHAPRWLQVEVDGEVLEPRRELVSAPYALYAEAGGSGDGHSLDASDGSPVDALYVDAAGNVGIGVTTPAQRLHVEGVVQVGSSSEGGQILIHSPGAVPANLELTGMGTYGGFIGISDVTGVWHTTLGHSFSVGGGGRITINRNAAGDPGFVLSGNGANNEEPLLDITGSSRSATFDMSVSGNASVELPQKAIDNLEILDEPGVASYQTLAEISLALYPSATNIASRQITAPDDGYVLAIGTAEASVYHPGVPGGVAAFGVSEVSGQFSSHAQAAEVAIPSGASGGTYRFPVTVHGLFEVSSGENNFYFVGQAAMSGCSAAFRQFTLVYLPSGFGIVDTTVELASLGGPEEGVEGVGVSPRPVAGGVLQNAGHELADVVARLERLEERVDELE